MLALMLVDYTNIVKVTPQRVARFEKAFGKVNDEVVIADHVVGIVNSVNIDASAVAVCLTSAYLVLYAHHSHYRACK